MRGVAKDLWDVTQHAQHTAQRKPRLPYLLAKRSLLPKNSEAVLLELDEMWSFVKAKRYKRWVELILCKQTRQVVGCASGGRGIDTCKKLWSNVPELYKQGVVFSDFREAYQAVIPDEQHQAGGKDSGLTAHIAGPRGPGVARPYAVERFNNTLRQRLARFVRKTISFSKSEHIHLICLQMFLVRYNLDLLASSLE